MFGLTCNADKYTDLYHHFTSDRGLPGQNLKITKLWNPSPRGNLNIKYCHYITPKYREFWRGSEVLVLVGILTDSTWVSLYRTLGLKPSVLSSWRCCVHSRKVLLRVERGVARHTLEWERSPQDTGRFGSQLLHRYFSPRLFLFPSWPQSKWYCTMHRDTLYLYIVSNATCVHVCMWPRVWLANAHGGLCL